MRTALMSMVLLALGMAACGKTEVLSVVESPEGRNKFLLIAREPFGGALSPAISYWVEVRAGDQNSLPERIGTVVWRSEGIEPLYVFWIDDHELEVVLRPGTAASEGVLDGVVQGMTVTTRVPDSTAKHAILGRGD
jgi:hypothetical protein